MENGGRGPDAGCLLVLVDSSTGSEIDDSKSPDPRSPLVDYVLDTNALSAIDAMMKRRRADTLFRMGIDLSKRDRLGIRPHVNPKAPLMHVFDRGFLSNGVHPAPPSCFVWHVGLDTVDEIFEAEPSQTWEVSDAQRIASKKFIQNKYRPALAGVARTIATNYKLKSSVCRHSEDIALVLRAAAGSL